MSKRYMFEKPIGMRDTLPELYELKRQVRESILSEVACWGYSPVETPTLEFHDTVGEASAILDQQLFKLLDQEGNTLVLRPDMTAPIARIVASTLKNAERPLRLTYDAPVFRSQQREGGKSAEFEQVGIELIGDKSNSADGEVIALMMSSLEKSGLQSYQIAVGHVGFVNALLKDILGSDERAGVFRRYLYEKNYVGFRQEVDQLPLSSIDKQRLNGLLGLKGGPTTIEKARDLVETDEGKEALNELENLMNVLESYNLTDHVLIDLNLVMHMSYYTGTVFEAYSDELGYPLGSGGRYDQLLNQFNGGEPATGFGVRLDRLTEALGKTKEAVLHDVCFVFSEERRKEAMEQAKELRAEGRSAVMQDITGLTNVDAFTKQFREVIYLVGSNGNGGSKQ
ncbi:ATP phosphoribosyltransferase regulatory subunit [Bacillus shivajii]|uniref:ATP phosphoribosyltransferase regulatory subunit n=1 Tax=Bacillus shivajii TaxID=1983719 RepID=UPI001CFBA0BC|nr:ATP phosphoribosyltransferase regulatory subunit [Bacillus shivajii]UCZ52645.1 ATP phosphoribosyltransferase regulatory subunit [Bacillus shivajii]